MTWPRDGTQIGRVEIPWSANVYVVLEEGGHVVQVRHGVDDQREDPIRLGLHEAAELAYQLLRAVAGETSAYDTPRREDLARLLAAFGQIRELRRREVREALERAEMRSRGRHKGGPRF